MTGSLECAPCPDSSIATVGCRYLLLDAETGEQTPLPAIGKETTAAMVALPGGEIMLSLDGQTQVFGAWKRTVYGSLPAPLFAPQLKDMLVPCYNALDVAAVRGRSL